MPPDRGHIVFVLPVCLFVCLLSTLTFAITFEPLEVETSYFAYSTNDALSSDTKVNDSLKIAFLDFVAAGGIVSVSQTHLDFFI